VRAISRRRAEALNSIELELARRYSVDTLVALPWMSLQFGLLYLGIISVEVGEFFGPVGQLAAGLCLVMVLVFVVLAGITIARTRRVRRFLAVNGQPVSA
jgi:hypothetical protein